VAPAVDLAFGPAKGGTPALIWHGFHESRPEASDVRETLGWIARQCLVNDGGQLSADVRAALLDRHRLGLEDEGKLPVNLRGQIQYGLAGEQHIERGGRRILIRRGRSPLVIGDLL